MTYLEDLVIYGGYGVPSNHQGRTTDSPLFLLQLFFHFQLKGVAFRLYIKELGHCLVIESCYKFHIPSHKLYLKIKDKA